MISLMKKPIIFFIYLLFIIVFFPVTSFALTGDLDQDGDVDRDDLSILLEDRNRLVSQSSCGSACDLDGDGIITVLDARKLVLLCTLPRCAIVSHENSPPVADAGKDLVIAIPRGQTTVDITLDGSTSYDPDGNITQYIWTGDIDPEDVVSPVVSLKQGVYDFTLQVKDDKGAISNRDNVKIIILGTPYVVPLPSVSFESSITLRGQTVPGVNVIIRGGAEDILLQASTTSGYFQTQINLSDGENKLRIYAEYNGVESLPSEVSIIKTNPGIVIENVTPDTGQSGAILTISGSGFTPDKDKMGVYFKGGQQEDKGFVLFATETLIKVVVPFVFLNTDDEIQLYVYSDTDVSNSISFHVFPSTDPTPDIQGNETSHEFDLLILKVQKTLGKLEQLVKPHITDDSWGQLQENITRILIFLQNVKDSLPIDYDPQMLTSLDSIFGSDIFTLINHQIDKINEILSHSSTGEAICNVNEVLEILNEIISILRWIDRALIAGEAICFFVCQPALPVLEVVRNIVEGILDILNIIRDVLNLAPTKADAKSWHIDITGPYKDVDPHIMFTRTNNTLALYADFSNGNFNRFIGRISSIGKHVLDLLGIEIGKITIQDVNVPSTAQSLDPSLVSNITTGNSSDIGADIHELQVFDLPDGVDRQSVSIDVQGSCGAYHYPDKLCMTLECLTDPPDYPQYYDVTVIEAPIIDKLWWDFTLQEWFIQGVGFSKNCGEEFKVFWNGEELSCSCIIDLDWNSFFTSCGRSYEPGRIELMLVNPDDPDNQNYWRKGPSQPTGLPPFYNVLLGRIVPSSGYIGDIVTIRGEHFTPYPEDMTIYFYNPDFITSIHPTEIIPKIKLGDIDILKFKVPEELHSYEGQTLGFSLCLSSEYIAYGNPCAEGQFTLRKSESAFWGDQDLIAFASTHSYVSSVQVGDISGDGINDLIVGVEQERSAEGQYIGAVYIAFGPIEGDPVPTGQQYLDLDINSMNINWDVVIFGDSENRNEASNYSRRIGNSLALGDINGDGIDDLLIGSTDRDYDMQHGLNAMVYRGIIAHVIPGRAYVFYGKPAEQWNRTINVAQDSDILIEGGTRELGYQVLLANLNGDNFKDIIISAPGLSFDPDFPEFDYSGRVYVIFGSANLPGYIDVENIPVSINGVVIAGENLWQRPQSLNSEDDYKGDMLGEGIATGDINGDGMDDLAIGAPGYYRHYHGVGNVSISKGAVFIFYGNNDFGGTDRVLNAFTVDGEQDVMVLGPQVTESLHGCSKGWEIGKVMLISDLNNDGRGELILGSPHEYLDYSYYYDLHESQIGMIYIISGDSIPDNGIIKAYDIAKAKIYGSKTLSRFGAALAAGDINGDGYMDLFVGAPGKQGSEVAGSVWGFYGSDTLPSGIIYLADRRGVPEDFMFKGEQVHSEWKQGFGTYIAIGDLLPFEGNDVLIIDPLAKAPEPSDPTHQTWQEYSGMLYVFYEGDEVQWPLTIYPETVTMDKCSDQQMFRVYGGDPPYTLIWLSPDIKPEEVEIETYLQSKHSFIVKITDCLPYNMLSLKLRVRDSSFNLVDTIVNLKRPDISVDTTIIDFGELIGDYNRSQSFTITNTGEADLRIRSLYITGSLAFSLTDNCPEILSPQESCVVTVAFSPTIGGFYNGRVSIYSNDPEKGVYTVHITGKVIERPDIQLSPVSIEFTEIPLGLTEQKEVILINNGLSDLHIDDINISGTIHYTQTNDCDVTIAPGETCTITVTYDPVSQVYFTHWADLIIRSDDPDEPEVAVALSGYGIPSFISVEPESIDLGTVETNALLSISNTSSSSILRWSITSDLPSWLAVSTTSGETSPSVFERLIVNVDRTGLDAGLYQHNLSITSNGGVVSVPVSMEVSPYISVSPATVDFREARTRSMITIQNTSPTTTISWSINNDLPSWLTASQGSGILVPGSSIDVYLYADRTGLASDNTYTHILTITSNGGDKTVPVSMTVPVQLATFARYYGDSGSYGGEYFSVVRSTSDGGYIASGLTNSFGSDADNPWIVKLDSSGYIQWEYRYPGYGRVYDIKEVSDGGYMVVSSIQYHRDYRYFYILKILKINSYGDIEWQKLYDSEIDENMDDWGINFQIVEAVDGGFVIAGNKDVGGRSDFWVLKIDPSGNILWEKTYGGIYDDYANSVDLTSDSGYIVAGVTEVDDTNKTDLWILKIDSSGNIQWQKRYDDTGWNYAYQIKETSEGGYIVVGTTLLTGSAFLLKLDSSGNILWQKSYGEYGSQYYGSYGYSISQTADGGYIMTGVLSNRDGTGDNVWIVRVDQSGNILWQKRYGGDSTDVAYWIEQTIEGDYIVAGYTRSFRKTPYGSDNYDAWIMKTDTIGNIGMSCALIEWTEIVPAESSFVATDTSVIPVDSASLVIDFTTKPVDTNSTTDQLCTETVSEAQERDLVDITVEPTSYDFYGVLIGETVSHTFYIKNTGYQPLQINNITLSADQEFSLTHDCPLLLKAANMCRLTVSFTPVTDTEKSGFISIESDDPDEPVVNINLTGSGYICYECPGEGGGVIFLPP